MKNFTLINTNIIHSGQWSSVSLSAQNIYIILRRHSDPQYKPVWCGIQRIGKMAGLAKGTVINGIDELVQKGLIEIKKRGLKSIFYFVPWEGVKIKGKKIIHDSFISVDNELIDSGVWASLSNAVKQVYLMLIWKSGKQHEFQLSQSKLAHIIGISLATVKRAIAELSKLGIIIKKLKNGTKTIYSIVKKAVSNIQVKPVSKGSQTGVKIEPKQERTRKKQEEEFEQEEEGITYPFLKNKNSKILDFLNSLGIHKDKTKDKEKLLRREIIRAWTFLRSFGISHAENTEIWNRIERIKSIDIANKLNQVLRSCQAQQNPNKGLINDILDEMEVN